MKERILGRAFELFSKNGIKAISMADIAQDLGISKKTIYKFFENKDQLVEETLTAYLNELNFTGCPVNENPIEEFCCTLNSGIQKLFRLHTSFFFDLKKYHYRANQIWQDFKQQQMVPLFQANLMRGVESGLYRPDLNASVTARLYVGQLQAIYYADLFPPEEFNLQDTYCQNLKHFVLGIVSADGRDTLHKYQFKHLDN
jgi:TetR/AcrR family transcriptional regulator, cholesterol catabolism regulator